MPLHPVNSSNYTTVTGLRAGRAFLNHDWTNVVPCYSKSAVEWPYGVNMHISARQTRINPGLGVVAVARAYMSPFSASWTTLEWSSKAFGQWLAFVHGKQPDVQLNSLQLRFQWARRRVGDHYVHGVPCITWQVRGKGFAVWIQTEKKWINLETWWWTDGISFSSYMLVFRFLTWIILRFCFLFIGVFSLHCFLELLS